MRRHFLLPILALASLLAAPSCLSPTLPLPPPEVSTIAPSTTAGSWDVFGDCTPGALVTVLNEKTGRGVVVEDRTLSGRFQVTIEGAECDVASVRQDIGLDESAPNAFVLAAYSQPGDPHDNPACHAPSP